MRTNSPGIPIAVAGQNIEDKAERFPSPKLPGKPRDRRHAKEMRHQEMT